MRRQGPLEELFDTATDPDEINNLATSTEPQHREAPIRLRAALDTWMLETGDRGAIPEAPGIRLQLEKEMHQ